MSDDFPTAPSRPGIYEDAVGALWNVHFDDGRESRLLVAPLVSVDGTPVDAPTIGARGPFTAYVALTEVDRRRVVAALRICARLEESGTFHGNIAEALRQLADRVEAIA